MAVKKYIHKDNTNGFVKIVLKKFVIVACSKTDDENCCIIWIL